MEFGLVGDLNVSVVFKSQTLFWFVKAGTKLKFPIELEIFFKAFELLFRASK